MSMPALFKGRLSIPVIGSPLFIISVPDLVIAQCKAGVVGSFPALNARPAALLDEWIARMEKGAAANPNAARPTITHEIPQVAITGTVAHVQVELSRDGRHTFTDHLLLYKFANGWKIVSKAFYTHPR